jgi:hypothetical protein
LTKAFVRDHQSFEDEEARGAGDPPFAAFEPLGGSTGRIVSRDRRRFDDFENEGACHVGHGAPLVVCVR